MDVLMEPDVKEGLERWIRKRIREYGRDRKYWMVAILIHGTAGVEAELAGKPVLTRALFKDPH